MANIKISELPEAGSITGSELVPVVQGGVTKKSSATAVSRLLGGVPVILTSPQTGDLIELSADGVFVNVPKTTLVDGGNF